MPANMFMQKTRVDKVHIDITDAATGPDRSVRLCDSCMCKRGPVPFGLNAYSAALLVFM